MCVFQYKTLLFFLNSSWEIWCPSGSLFLPEVIFLRIVTFVLLSYSMRNALVCRVVQLTFIIEEYLLNHLKEVALAFDLELPFLWWHLA